MDDISKPGYFKTLMITGSFNRLIIYISTAVSVAICIIFALLQGLGIINIGFLNWQDFIIFAALSGTGIYGFYQYFHLRKIYKIDYIFPDFVRDLAESRRAGMTFTKAIMFSAKGNYGMLTEEINKVAQQISWGSSVNEALSAFASRVNTKSIKRTVSLIIEASKSGGNVADVLDVAANDAREIRLIESERRAIMSSYVVVIYVGMFVFLAIIVILVTQFIPAMTGQAAQGMAMDTGKGSVSSDQIVPVFFYATIVQGFGSGAVAGVFEEGTLTAGIKHVFIIVLVTWFTFKFMMGV